MVDAADWGAWRALVEKALAGAPYESLKSTISDGRGGTIALDPLAPPAEPVFSGRPYPGPWSVVQRVDADEGAAPQALDDLQNGADALAIVFAGAPAAFGRGLAIADVDGLDWTLEGVKLDLVPLHLEAGARGREALALLLALAERRGTVPAALHAGLDPLGAHAAGAPLRHMEGAAAELADAARAVADLGPANTALLADGRPLAEAGAGPVEELAFALHALAEYLALLAGEGLSPAKSLPLVALGLSASQDQFATIAKLRAARRLHRLLADACGVEAPARLHVSALRRMLAVSDPHTNLLRLTIAAFSAGVGGADAITLLPFDEAATPFARRLARNTQTLLIEESHVARLEDPGAGSGTVEALTDAIAEAAWALFQSRAGTPLASLIGTGALAPAPAAEPVIIGVTRHPPKTPTAPLGRPAVAPPATRHGVSPGPGLTGLLAAAACGATLADLEAPAPPVRPAPAAALTPTRASAHHEAA